MTFRWARICVILALAAGQGNAQAPARSVAVTIDDLPFAQSGPQACEPDRLRALTSQLLAPIRAERIPVTAFVIGSQCPQLSEAQRTSVLRMWREAGAELGNHTFAHKGLNTTAIADYAQSILQNEPVLAPVTKGQKHRYFRSPMLQTGTDAETRQRLVRFLREHNYLEAPVTLDNSDWMFAYVYHAASASGDKALAERSRTGYVPYLESVIAWFEKRSVEVVGREFPQVLLLHANELNAEMLPAVLSMIKDRGYRFVSLDEALRDAAYRLPNEYAGKGGFSWIHRWSMTKAMPKAGEPDEPEWLQEAYRRLSQPH